ncbi:MAG: phage tail tape measure protein [Christensenellaceae bacterium]
MKAFNIEAENSVRIINVVNEVANKFAVGSNDLQSALTKAGSSLGVLGNSYEETVGIITAGTEIMVGQSSKVSRGVRTIGINLAKMATETGVLETATGKAAISLKDENGEMKSTFDIMSDLYPIWQTLNEEQKTMLAQTVAGKNQFEVFVNTLNNFGTAIDATAVAMNSENSAVEENTIYMQSMKAKLNELKSTFEDFSRKTMNGEVMKSLIDLSTLIIKLADNDVVRLIAVIGTLSVATKGFAVASKAILATNFGSKIAIWFGIMTSGAKGFTASMLELKAVLLSHPIMILATVAFGVAKAWNYVARANERYIQTVRDGIAESEKQKSNYDSEISSLESLQSSLEDAKGDKGKLLSISSDLNKVIGDSPDLINGESAAYEIANQKIKDRIKYLKEQSEAEKNSIVSSKKDIFSSEEFGVKMFGFQTGTLDLKTTTTLLDASIKKMEEAKEKGQDYSDWEKSVADMTAFVNSKVTEAQEIFSTFLTDSIPQDVSIANQFIDSLIHSGESNLDNINSQVTGFVAELQAVEDLKNKYYEATAKGESGDNFISDLSVSIDELKLKYPFASEAIDMLTNGISGMTPVIVDNTKTFSELSDELVNISDKMSILSGAQIELAETGSITAKTFKALVDNDLIQYLEIVDGKATLSGKALYAMGEDARSSAIGSLQKAAADDMAAIATGKVNDITPFAAKAIKDAGTNAKDSAPEINAMSGALAGLAVSASEAYKAISGGESTGLNVDELTANIKAVENAYKGAIIGIGNFSFGGGGGGKSSSRQREKAKTSAKVVADTWKKEFDLALKELQYKRDKDVISESEYYKQLEALNNKYFKNKSKYLDDYRKYEIEVYKFLKSSEEKRLAEIEQKEKERIENIKEAFAESLDSEKKQIEASLRVYEAYADKQSEFAQSQIDILNEEKLKLQELNDEREDSIRLQQLEDSLAKAKMKQVRIYREGVGFVYEQDSIAVSDAQENLHKYKREESLKHELKIIDEKIKAWEIEKEKWSEVVSNYKEQQDLLLAEQLSGISLEALNQEERLKNLSNFVEEYNLLMSQLASVELELEMLGQKPLQGQGSLGFDKDIDYQAKINEALARGDTDLADYYNQQRNEKIDAGYGGNQQKNDSAQSNSSIGFDKNTDYQAKINDALASGDHASAYYYNQQRNEKIDAGYGGNQQKHDKAQSNKTYANGTLNYSGGAMVVGENVGEHNREIITPPKGSGIIPNPITERLMNFGENPITFLSTLIRRPSFSQNASGQSVVENYNISGVNVTANNMTEFIDSIKTVKARAIQRTTNRK